MTTLTLQLDPETKRFERADGPALVHAGELLRLRLLGLGLDAETANATAIPAVPDEPEDAEVAEDAQELVGVPALRVRLHHGLYGDLAAYPWPGTAPAWRLAEADGALECDLSLDVQQLFSVVRAEGSGGIALLAERPWPHPAPALYGACPMRVEDWPEPTGETRVYPATGRYAKPFAAAASIPALGEDATLSQVIAAVNAALLSLKNAAEY